MKLVRINKSSDTMDSIVERKTLFGEKADPELLTRCEALWNNLRDFRRARDRALRFVYGDQWGDLIEVNGKTMTQREYLSQMGNVALQTNQVKKIVSTISGAWVKENNSPECHARDRREQQLAEVLTTVTQTNWERNDMPMLLADEFLDALIGGMCVMKETYERDDEGRLDALSHSVSPNQFFFDANMQDPRFKDMTLVGELLDYSFNDLCAGFAESPEDYRRLREIYDAQAHPLKTPDNIMQNDRQSEGALSFRQSRDSSKCRVICVWTKERRPRYKIHDEGAGTLVTINADDTAELRRIEQINRERKAEAKRLGLEDGTYGLVKKYWFMDTYWFYRYMTPDGEILREGESDLPNRSHPYSICAVPFINGKIVSYINDAIDQNIAMNRFLTIDDWIRRSGAKGVTFVPQNIIPDGMDYKTFAEQWTSINGIVFYKPTNNNDKPFTEFGNVGTLNTAELVKLMNDLMQDSVSVSGAIQGKTPHAGTSAALYSQERENSTTPMAPLMLKFDTFVKNVAYKKSKFIAAFYTPDRYLKIAGMEFNGVPLEDIIDLDYDFKIVSGADVPTLRMQSNELLINAVQMGQLGIVDALHLGEFANADQIEQYLNKRAQEAQAQGQEVGNDYEQKRQMLMAN